MLDFDRITAVKGSNTFTVNPYVLFDYNIKSGKSICSVGKIMSMQGNKTWEVNL